MNTIFANYPDIVNEALFPMIISIFVIALPLLLQTISRVDDKYNSTKLIDAFKKDWICYSYIAVILAAIIAYIVWILQIPRLIDCGPLNAFIDYSAVILVGTTVIGLIMMTFGVVYLTYIYYCPEKLLKRLMRQHHKKSKKRKIYFEAISSILFYSIQKADESLARQLLKFYYSTFIEYRSGKEKKLIEYPQEYYNSIFEANELLCMRDRRTISYFHDAILFDLFLDSNQNTVISPTTYAFIWRCLLQVLHYNRDEFVVSYWGKAHQLFVFSMQSIEKEYNSQFQIVNQDEIDSREKEREAFLEFHYALGGLLTYLNRYELLKEIMNWTNQQPPRYVLVPERMDEVIKRYMDVSNKGGYINPIYYAQRYPFPNLSGVNADGVIQMWIKRYLSILFLRQYSLHRYYTYSDPLNMPTLPSSLSELKYWDDELDSLNLFTKHYKEDKDILAKLELSSVSKESSSDLINKLKKEINDRFEWKKQSQEVDPDELEKFKEATIRILLKVFEEYSSVFKGRIDSNYKSLFIRGHYKLMEKAAFAANQEISYVDSDSIMAEQISLDFCYTSLNAFIFMNPPKYVLKEDDIFASIDKLNLDSTQFIIVAIGVDFTRLFMKNIQGLKNQSGIYSYRELEILEVQNQMNEFVKQSFFIIRKSDLPSIVYNSVNSSIISKFKMERIDAEKNIYANIIDLNKSEYKSLRDEIAQKNKDDLAKFVLVCIGINIEVRYKQDAKCIQLKIFNQFDDRGSINSLSDVQSIWI